MAENLTIARPYAKAAFDFAKEHNALDNWNGYLESLVLVCKSEVIESYLKESTSVTACNAIVEILKDIVDEYFINFIKILAENNRFTVVNEIYEEFTHLKNEQENILDLHVISAKTLHMVKSLVLSDQTPLNSSKVKVTTSIDESIIGGVILKVGDKVIDASVKTSLNTLSSTLK